MTKESELYEAAKAVLEYLKASTDDTTALVDLVYRHRIAPADRLRREADEIEARDAAIIRFRDAVAAFDVNA